MSRQAAVLGSPISHSLSPALHRAAYRALGLDWSYQAFDVDEQRLPGFVGSLDGSWVGLSLTMPLKEAVLNLASDITWTAEVTTSANTLLLPTRQAHNTDVDGIVTALQRAGFAQPTGFEATVLGSGATARSAIAACQRLGATQIHLLARRPEASSAAIETAERSGVTMRVHPFDRAAALDVPLVIATVPAGAADALAPGIPAAPEWLLDVVYAPWPTTIADAWRARGGTIVSGLEMLLAQAERQVELMTGMPAPSDAMRAALRPTHA